MIALASGVDLAVAVALLLASATLAIYSRKEQP